MGSTVGVVEPHELARRGLGELLASVGSVEVLHLAASATEVLASLGGAAADLFIVPSDLDRVDLDQLRSGASASMALLVLLRFPGPESVAAAVRLGATGFLLEPSLTTTTLADAIDRVASGNVAMPSQLLPLLDPSSASVTGHPVALTSRERQVLDLLAEGHANKQIAAHLDISVHAVKRHVANIFLKLQCDNRTMAVSRWLGQERSRESNRNCLGSPLAHAGDGVEAVTGGRERVDHLVDPGVEPIPVSR